MSRVAELGKPYPQAIQQAFDRIMGEGVPPLILFTTLASSDRAWRKFLGGSLLDGDLLTLRQRELVINRACALAHCEYEWGVHVSAFSERAGLTVSEIAATLRVPLDKEQWANEEAALLSAVDALHERATLNAEEFSQLRGHFNDQQIIEILMLAGFYRTVAYVANGLDLPLEKHAARFADYAS